MKNNYKPKSPKFFQVNIGFLNCYRYNFVIPLLAIFILIIDGRSTDKEPKVENTTHNCPFTKIIEDIFKINNQSSINTVDDKAVNDTYDFMYKNHNISKTIQDELVNDIIASIKRIKANLTYSENHSLNEAIILNVPNDETDKSTLKKVNQLKSGIEDKVDMLLSVPKEKNSNTNNVSKKPTLVSNSDTTKYVEVLTIEPNNTSINNSTSHTILEVLKNIMPALNTSINKDVHSITIIEKNQNKNHSYTETKNISKIIVKYCDKDNVTETNGDEIKNAENLKSASPSSSLNEDDYEIDDETDYGESDDEMISSNATEATKDVLEAAEYGLQKMHELYGILEPKLYSMGKCYYIYIIEQKF